ncbi:helix-turn-helix domain-containing protein [Saccharopolyspora pogona]|uniref:helix-turn-helix domain-containing protein n=1 Tax=Saccharopolyspora pogona TaxID=333966 RepID=UPI0016873F5E|nr:XRE family transcriptional regulator [Saccharopolyspora pogona]
MASLVRALRRERGLTLEELGGLTGLTKSYLSKVERELSTPSIAVALKIAEALDVDVSRLFVGETGRSAITIDRIGDRQAGARLQPLGADMLGKVMSPFVLRPTAEFVKHEPTHTGQEFIFVHSGTIELHYDGEEFELETGESAYLDATRAHRLRSTSESEAQVVIVATAYRP